MNIDVTSQYGAMSATCAAALIASRRLTSTELVEACLDRIVSREPTVRAWAYLDHEAARKEAKQRDNAPISGPLHGVPIAVKDVIDVSQMPSGMGSPIYNSYRPLADAACVALLRAAGAIIIGKTVTAEFAGVFPGATTNPLAPSHTPGGSSSGSAAAVADGMVPLALGTQTGGSIIRPAAFCGVIGFKPSFGTANRAGLKFAAESLDTIGLLARDIDDVELAWRILVGRVAARVLGPTAIPRFALFRTHHWDKATASTIAAVESTADRLRAAGAIVTEIPLPDGFAELSDARVVINGYERARALTWEFQNAANRLSPALTRVLYEGWSFSDDRYLEAVRTAERWRAWYANLMMDHDAVLTASVNGEAPRGLTSTGDASFQEIWTVLHVPSITLPLYRGETGLPVGVQLVGRRLDDVNLLGLARWVMQVSATNDVGQG
jgi:amidase